MKRSTRIVGVVVLAELLICGVIYFQKSSQPTPPIPNLKVVDSLTAADLEAAAQQCVSPQQWHHLAELYMAYGFYPEARSTFARAVALQPKSADFAFDYAFCLARTGDLDESNQQFENAIELGHSNPAAARFFIGRNYLRAEDPEAAAESFRKSSKIPLAKFELAKILFRQDKLDESEKLLIQVLTEEPNTIQPYVLLAQIAQQRGDEKAWLANSIEGASKWLRVESPFGKERQKLRETVATIGYEKLLYENTVLVNQKQHLEARRGLKKLQEIEWNLFAQDALIRCAIQSAQVPVSVKLIEERIDRFGPASLWLSRLAESKLKMGRNEEAVEDWIRGGKLNSDEAGLKCYEFLGRYFLTTGNDEETSEKYQAIGILHAVNESLKYEKFEDAERFAESAIELDGQSSEAYYLLGRAKLGVAKSTEAIEAFQKCLELEPTHGRAQRQLKALGEL